MTYNAKEQTATQTDTAQYVSPMTFTGRGQFERVSDTDTNGTHTYTYSALGLTKIVGSTGTYVRDPSGGLVSQQNVTGGPYYYLSDEQGNVGGMADSTGGQAAGYLNCPTGNTAEAPWGSNPLVNPYRQYGAYYDASFQSYWIGGQQIDANSGNAFDLSSAPECRSGNIANCYYQIVNLFAEVPYGQYYASFYLLSKFGTQLPEPFFSALLATQVSGLAADMTVDQYKRDVLGVPEPVYDEGFTAPLFGSNVGGPQVFLPGAEISTHTLDLWPVVMFGSEPGRLARL